MGAEARLAVLRARQDTVGEGEGGGVNHEAQRKQELQLVQEVMNLQLIAVSLDPVWSISLR